MRKLWTYWQTDTIVFPASDLHAISTKNIPVHFYGLDPDPPFPPILNNNNKKLIKAKTYRPYHRPLPPSQEFRTTGFCVLGLGIVYHHSYHRKGLRMFTTEGGVFPPLYIPKPSIYHRPLPVHKLKYEHVTFLVVNLFSRRSIPISVKEGQPHQEIFSKNQGRRFSTI